METPGKFIPEDLLCSGDCPIKDGSLVSVGNECVYIGFTSGGVRQKGMCSFKDEQVRRRANTEEIMTSFELDA